MEHHILTMTKAKLTQNAVLNVLRDESPLAFIEIAQRLGICRQTVSHAVEGLLVEEKVTVKPIGCARLVYAAKSVASGQHGHEKMM